MLHMLRKRAEEEKGFTLIELLVVILIIGILAAIAIPSFLNQKSKATDVAAKALVRSAETAAETVATNANGSYASVTAATLTGVDASIVACGTGVPFPCISAASGSAGTYSITATSASATVTTFGITNTNGVITRPCSPVSTGGCPASGFWG